MCSGFSGHKGFLDTGLTEQFHKKTGTTSGTWCTGLTYLQGADLSTYIKISTGVTETVIIQAFPASVLTTFMAPAQPQSFHAVWNLMLACEAIA